MFDAVCIMRHRKQRPTLRMLADKAGVSVGAASRALPKSTAISWHLGLSALMVRCGGEAVASNHHGGHPRHYLAESDIKLFRRESSGNDSYAKAMRASFSRRDQPLICRSLSIASMIRS